MAPVSEAAAVAGMATISGVETIVAVDLPKAALLAEGEPFDGRYTIERQIGAGAMGVVYAAQDQITRRQVAIKLINPALADKPSSRERFLREGLMARDVRHQNVVAILVPFDPTKIWGAPVMHQTRLYKKKIPVHFVRGTLAGVRFDGWTGRGRGRCENTTRHGAAPRGTDEPGPGSRRAQLDSVVGCLAYGRCGLLDPHPDVTAVAKRAAHGEDDEADSAQEQSDTDHDPEERDLLS